MTKLEKGLVQVYTGNGKGKTTAAFGLALRAVGRGLKVYVIQFIKGGFDYGELYVVDKLQGLTLKAFGKGKFIIGKPEEVDVVKAREALKLTKEVVSGGKYDLVVLDEVNVALHLGLIGLDDVLRLVREKPVHVELVLTGRNAPDEILQVADLVTEMREVKHPYSKGVPARKGIEY